MGKDSLDRFEKFPAGRSLKGLLPGMLKKLDKERDRRSWEAIDRWPNIVGEKVALQTRALKFEGGILFVKVLSAILYSILAHEEKGRLLAKLKKELPSLEIKDIVFRR